MEEQFDFHAKKDSDGDYEYHPISEAAKELSKSFMTNKDGAIPCFGSPERQFRKGTKLGDSGLTYKIID